MDQQIFFQLTQTSCLYNINYSLDYVPSVSFFKALGSQACDWYILIDFTLFMSCYPLDFVLYPSLRHRMPFDQGEINLSTVIFSFQLLLAFVLLQRDWNFFTISYNWTKYWFFLRSRIFVWRTIEDEGGPCWCSAVIIVSNSQAGRGRAYIMLFWVDYSG